MASVKGVLVTAMTAFLKKQYGPDAFEAAIEALPPEEGGVLQKKFLDASMYPYETMIALRHVMQSLVSRQLANDPERQAAAPSALGAFIAEHVFTGVFKPLLAQDPVSMVAKIPRVKNFFYDDYDRVEAAMTGDAACRVVYRYEEGVRPTRAGCLGLGSFWSRTLELSGAGQVAMTHKTCLRDGADHCEFLFTW